jgi:hypothetical protein
MGLPTGNRFRLRSFLVSSPSLRKEQDTPLSAYSIESSETIVVPRNPVMAQSGNPFI